MFNIYDDNEGRDGKKSFDWRVGLVGRVVLDAI